MQNESWTYYNTLAKEFEDLIQVNDENVGTYFKNCKLIVWEMSADTRIVCSNALVYQPSEASRRVERRSRTPREGLRFAQLNASEKRRMLPTGGLG